MSFPLVWTELLLKVLHVYRTYYPDTQGGLEEVIRQICLNAKQFAIESRVLSLSREPQFEPILKRPEAEVYRERNQLEIASCGMSLPAITRFKELAKWADVIHYHFPWPFADVLHLIGSPACPTVVTYHSDIVRQAHLNAIYRPIMNRFLQSVDRIVATSPNYFATSDNLIRYSDKVETIPIGIDENSYPPISPEADALVRKTYGTGYFIFIGVLRYYKGLNILLDAMQGAPFRVLIVGSGPTENELKETVRNRGMRNVIFTGYVDDEEKVALLKNARAVVFPSYLRSEAFGVTLLEGCVFGKPLISTEVGSGTSHVNIHGKTGLVIPPGSAKALREAMEFVYDNPNRANEMGANSRARFERHFTGNKMAERYVALYKSLAQERCDTAHNG